MTISSMYIMCTSINFAFILLMVNMFHLVHIFRDSFDGDIPDFEVGHVSLDHTPFDSLSIQTFPLHFQADVSPGLRLNDDDNFNIPYLVDCVLDYTVYIQLPSSHSCNMWISSINDDEPIMSTWAIESIKYLLDSKSGSTTDIHIITSQKNSVLESITNVK